MWNCKELGISGVFFVEHPEFSDNRGKFIKIHTEGVFDSFDFEVKEEYYSISYKNVIRGMHFQNPPKDHHKMVKCISGQVTDVILDIRKNSKTFGKFIVLDLNENDGRLLLIPSGCAHGFVSKTNQSIMLYRTTTSYDSKYDDGIRYDSFGYDWGIKDPIISSRDLSFELFKDFQSQF